MAEKSDMPRAAERPPEKPPSATPVVVALLIVCISAFAGLFYTFGLAARERRAAEVAVAESRAAEQRAREEVARSAAVLEMLKQVLSADGAAASQEADVSATQPAGIRRMLDAAALRLASNAASRPRSEALAELHAVLAEAYERIGARDAARRELQQAIDVLRKSRTDEPRRSEYERRLEQLESPRR